jgi:hypothetical protein
MKVPKMKAMTEFEDGMRFLEEHAWEVAKVFLDGDHDLPEELLDQIEDEIDYFYCKGVARGLWIALSALQLKPDGMIEPEAPCLLN